MHELPHVRHARPYLEINFDASALRTLSEPPRVIEQRLICAHVNQQRRQPVQVFLER